MNQSWIEQWFDNDKSSVIRRAVADVEKSSGGGNATPFDLVFYLQGRSDGPYTVLEIDGYYVVIRGTNAAQIKVHDGTPSLM